MTNPYGYGSLTDYRRTPSPAVPRPSEQAIAEALVASARMNAVEADRAAQVQAAYAGGVSHYTGERPDVAVWAAVAAVIGMAVVRGCRALARRFRAWRELRRNGA